MRDELTHRWLGFDRDDLDGWFAAAGLEPLRWLQRRRTAEAGDGAFGGREGFNWPDVQLGVAAKPAGA
jgi:hypothetical protein